MKKALRGLLADGGYDIYCTGSNARMLSGELATFLSGRYVEFRIWGLNYSEFMQFHQLEDSDETFSRYYKFGGLPYLVNLPFDEGIVSEYLRGIYNTILLKDIVDSMVFVMLDNYRILPCIWLTRSAICFRRVVLVNI